MPHEAVSRWTEEVFMSTVLRWTSADLAVLPDDGKRYEIIDGELYISRQPHWHHQRACGKIAAARPEKSCARPGCAGAVDKLGRVSAARGRREDFPLPLKLVVVER